MSKKFGRRALTKRASLVERGQRKKHRARTRQPAYKPLPGPSKASEATKPQEAPTTPPEILAGPLNAPNSAAGSAGSGGHSGRLDNGLTPIENAKLNFIAVRNKWCQPTKLMDWAYEASAADFAELTKELGGHQHLPPIDLLMLNVMNDIGHEDPKVRAIAGRTLVTMRGQSLSDSHHKDRQDFANRSLAARVGTHAAGLNINSTGPTNVVVCIPHNNRDPAPPGAILGSLYDKPSIPMPTVDTTDIDGDDEGDE